ncbi:MAG: glucose-6-phosphate isomerase [Bdellovibrio sp. CG10_big_fil_rev_8_21_14_0_10_47_8]|nr:MAG: glucose-6-phosphate isomerase [Bdellovibrio sp. CG10_big_fil_rev_8_21_14_0_10_47_8]
MLPFRDPSATLSGMIKILETSQKISDSSKNRTEAAYQKVLTRQDLGFHQMPDRLDLWTASQNLGRQLADSYDNMVVVGIGGSSLGPRALYEVLQNPKSKQKLYFCDNVDGVEFSRLWDQLSDLKKTIWVLISKSGSTIETLVSADFIHQIYQQKNQQASMVVVSETKSSPMMDWAKQQSVPTLEIPVDVGGRFSVFTAVGMLPMAFLGFPPEKFRQGALWARGQKSLISELSAHFLTSFDRGEWISFFWYYSSLFQNFGRWQQQLWAESLAKTLDREGKAAARVSTPMWAIGSSDQHSLLQQVMDGAKDKFVVFARFGEIESQSQKLLKTQFPFQDFFVGHSMGELISAQAQGTCKALIEQKVSTLTLHVQDLSPECLGAQMMLWQLVVATVGESLDINAFDQPGVELGKRLARAILKS